MNELERLKAEYRAEGRVPSYWDQSRRDLFLAANRLETRAEAAETQLAEAVELLRLWNINGNVPCSCEKCERTRAFFEKVDA